MPAAERPAGGQRLKTLAVHLPGGPHETCDYLHVLCLGRTPSLLELREGLAPAAALHGADGEAAGESHRRAVSAGGAVRRVAPFAAVQQVALQRAPCDGERPVDRGAAAGRRVRSGVAAAFPHAGGGADGARPAPPRFRRDHRGPDRVTIPATTANGTAACPAGQLPLLSAAIIEYHDHGAWSERRFRRPLEVSRARRAKHRRKSHLAADRGRHGTGESDRHPPAAGPDRLRDPGPGVHEHRGDHQQPSPSSTETRGSCATGASPSRSWPRSPTSPRPPTC